jgi:hypothetical protein
MLDPSHELISEGYKCESGLMQILEKLTRLNPLIRWYPRHTETIYWWLISCSTGGLKRREELVLPSWKVKKWRLEAGVMRVLKSLKQLWIVSWANSSTWRAFRSCVGSYLLKPTFAIYTMIGNIFKHGSESIVISVKAYLYSF